MKTAQSAPELKWLLDGSTGPGGGRNAGDDGTGQGPAAAVQGKVDGGPGPPAAGSKGGKAGGGGIPKGPPAPVGSRAAGKGTVAGGDDDDDDNDYNDDGEQQVFLNQHGSIFCEHEYLSLNSCLV